MSKESELQKEVRLQYAKMGCLLWRNNVGVLQNQDGTYIRYGLANESRQMNKKVKSSDLIGINPLIITSAMVGMCIGQFIALECKKPGWVFNGTEVEIAQNNFHKLVISKGGYASFITGVSK